MNRLKLYNRLLKKWFLLFICLIIGLMGNILFFNNNDIFWKIYETYWWEETIQQYTNNFSTYLHLFVVRNYTSNKNIFLKPLLFTNFHMAGSSKHATKSCQACHKTSKKQLFMKKSFFKHYPPLRAFLCLIFYILVFG